LRYELLATLSRLADWNLKDHSLRCSYAAGDLRAHGQLILEELPVDPKAAIGVFLYDAGEAEAVGTVKSVVSEFFDGGHWASSLLPTRHDPRWDDLMRSAESARVAIIMNGLPAWNEASLRRNA
jgi:hypothetical protein